MGRFICTPSPAATPTTPAPPMRCDFTWAAALGTKPHPLAPHHCTKAAGHDDDHDCICDDYSEPESEERRRAWEAAPAPSPAAEAPRERKEGQG